MERAGERERGRTARAQTTGRSQRNIHIDTLGGNFGRDLLANGEFGSGRSFVLGRSFGLARRAVPQRIRRSSCHNLEVNNTTMIRGLSIFLNNAPASSHQSSLVRFLATLPWFSDRVWSRGRLAFAGWRHGSVSWDGRHRRRKNRGGNWSQ